MRFGVCCKEDDVCAICGAPYEEGATLCVDHDHGTNKVRGFLCRTCNIGIGSFKDDANLVAKALEYLLRTGDVDSDSGTDVNQPQA